MKPKNKKTDTTDTTDTTENQIVTWNELQDILPTEFISSVAVVADDAISVNDITYILTNIAPQEAVRKIQNYIIGQKKHG